MNRFKLFRLLRRNNQLGYRRSPAFEQSMVAKVLMIIGGAFFVLYLLMYGIMFAAIAADEGDYGMVFGILPFMTLIDFGIRFMVQQTPAVLMKPYVLLPLPRRAVVDTFLVTSLVSVYNWLWLFFFLPYGIVALAGGASIWQFLGIVVGGEFFIMANSQFYLIVRTLTGRTMFWWLLPIALWGGYGSLLAIGDGKAFETFSEWLVDWGYRGWGFVASVVLLASFYALNRWLQFRFIYEEIAGLEKKEAALKHVSQYTFFDRFGLSGEYLKLELKSITRNKVCRSRVIASLTLIVVLCLIVAYTDIYDGRYMLNFWCFYCFAIYGMTALVKVMAPEGNYIDLLMTQRENILVLLTAKYYFHVGILVIPFLLLLPAVIAGKFSLLMMVAYLLLTSGLVYGILFQLAVYNKQTLPLNQKITGKGNVENGLQLVIELVGMLLPFLMVFVLVIVFDETVAYLIMAAIGLVLTLLHPLWLRNIYHRLMARKYENLEGFHATR